MTLCDPALSTREHHRLADVLYSAAAAGRSLLPFTRWYPDLTPADGCRIRDLLLERRLGDGEQLIGAKVWLGSFPPAGGDGAVEPRLAWLTDGMLLDGTTADVSGLSRPRVEPKLAFRLGRRLRSHVPTATDVLAATEAVMPCLEVVDSRFQGSRPQLPDQVAENGATAMLMLGPEIPPPADGHLRRVRVNMRIDGPAPEPERERRSVYVPPLEAVGWLGGRLAAGSLGAASGTLLVSHAIGAAAELRRGVRVIAHFSGLGAVRLDTDAPPSPAA